MPQAAPLHVRPGPFRGLVESRTLNADPPTPPIPRGFNRPPQYRQTWHYAIENQLGGFVPSGPLPVPPAKVANWNAYQREYVQRRPATESPGLTVFDTGNQGNSPIPPPFQTPWRVDANLQHFYQPSDQYATTLITAPVVPDSPSVGAWVQNWAAYSREYVQRQTPVPLSIFDLGNQDNAALPALPVQDWTKYVREYVQGKLRQEPRVPAPTLRPEFYRPFATPWRVDLYPAQQPQDAFVGTILAPRPFVPPSNVRPLQSRVEWRLQSDNAGAQDYTIPDTFVPAANIRPLQYRTDWRIERVQEFGLLSGTSQPFVPSPVVRPLQHRVGWTLYDISEMGIPVQPINFAFYPYAAGARDLQTRQGWTMYRELGQAVFANDVTQDPNVPIVVEEEIYEFWDIPPYPRQQPKPGIAPLAVLIPRSVAYTISGGITFGGSPTYLRAYKWSPAGGIVFSGNASYTPVSTGVVVPTYIYNRRIFTKLNGKR